MLPGSSLFQGRALHQDMNIESVSVFQSPTMLQLIDIKGQGKDNLDDRMIKQETDFDLYQNRITII